MQKTAFLGLSILTLAGCSINRALIDPYAWAPKSAKVPYFSPDILQDEDVVSYEPYLPRQEAPYSQAEIIDIALKNNPNTTISWTAARAAAAQYAKTQAPFLPSIDGEGEADRAKIPFLTRNASNKRVVESTMSTRNTPQLQLAYTVLDFGQRRWTSEISRYSLYFSNWSHNREIQTVVKDVSNAYYSYLLETKKNDLRKQDLETAETTLNAVLEKQKYEDNASTDLLQAKTLLNQSAVDFEAQIQQVENTFADLLNTMGLSSDLNILVQRLPDYTDGHFSLKSVSALIGEALDLRPDLKASEALVKAQDSVLNLSYSDFFPTLFYDATLGRTYFKKGLHDKNDWSSTFTLQIPLFSGLRRINQIKKAKSELKNQKAVMRKKRLTITKEVRKAHSDVLVADKTLNKARTYLDSANRQYDSSLKKYKENQASILDVASAQTSLSSARDSFAKANFDWYSSLTNLIFAVGSYSFKPTVHEFMPEEFEVGQP